MKPSARLRTRPRSDSERLAIGAPWTRTSPPVGASSPPNRCKSVLLPDPDAPTIATRSPRSTARSMPRSTGTSSGPPRYVFLSAWHSSTGVAALFIAQGLRRVDFRGAPARVQRRQQRERKRDQRNQRDVAALQIGRQLADVIDALVQKLKAERALDGRHDGSDVERQRNAPRDADQRAGDSDPSSLDDEDGEDASRRRAQRAQDRDVGLLVGYHHHLGRDDIERRHGHDQRQDDEHDALLDGHRAEKIRVIERPVADLGTDRNRGKH